MDEKGLYFIDQNQQIQLQYKDLFVYDFRGKEMASKFQLDNSNNLLIIVEDYDAIYPLTIDPLSVTPCSAENLIPLMLISGSPLKGPVMLMRMVTMM